MKPSTDEGEDDSGFDYENFDDLKDFGQSLTNKYSQYSVLIQEPCPFQIHLGHSITCGRIQIKLS
ncbi:MAG: hypothetical protein SPI86_06920 [Treponemataceae bacterium]|nr:hypothetical protein [Spirochaetales bacterium]MDY6031476.1 hypothetical protein [Treponemataceae bacterium]